jgi:hypothetical protein
MYHGERLNSITHLVGTALAVVGAAALLARVAGQDDPWKITGVVLFGLGLVALYQGPRLAPRPRHLAPLRHGRQRQPLRGGDVLRGVAPGRARHGTAQR